MEDTSPCFILPQISSFATPVTPGLNPVIHFTMHNVHVLVQCKCCTKYSSQWWHRAQTLSTIRPKQVSIVWTPYNLTFFTKYSSHQWKYKTHSYTMCTILCTDYNAQNTCVSAILTFAQNFHHTTKTGLWTQSYSLYNNGPHFVLIWVIVIVMEWNGQTSRKICIYD